MRNGLLLIAFILIFPPLSPALAAHYVARDSIPFTLLPPPPAEKDAEWEKDVEVIIHLQETVDSEELKAAREEYKMRPELMISALDREVTRQDYPQLFALLDKVAEDGKDINHYHKDHWKTRRPYQASKKVKALIEAHGNPAYPSGHTSGSLIWAEVLGQLFPERQEALRDRAAEIALHRIQAGMHYPSDVTGGRILAYLTLGALWQSEAFRRDLEAARQEIAARQEP